MKRLSTIGIIFLAGIFTFLILTMISGNKKTLPKRAATSQDKLFVVGTVSPITNIIFSVGGDYIALHGLVPEGVNSHTFEPAPTDAKILSQADIIFVNGLNLELPTVKMAQANMKQGGQIVTLADQTIKQNEWVFDFSFPKEGGDPNPHLWLNPMHALRYGKIVKDTLATRDPHHAASYEKNYETFKMRIGSLDEAIKKAISTIPEKNRKLVTYHDSFAYFAPRYGMSVMAAIQPSSFSQPSAREVGAIITQLKESGVPAIFGSEVFPSTVLAQIGREANVAYIDTLRDDDLPGKPGDSNHSYIGLMVEDVRTITKALGGDPSALDSIATTNIPGQDQKVLQGRIY